MTAATGFKRLGLRCSPCIAAGAGVLAGARYPDFARQRCARQALSEIRAVTGLDPVLRGDITVRCFRPAASASTTWCSATGAAGARPPTADRAAALLPAAARPRRDRRRLAGAADHRRRYRRRRQFQLVGPDRGAGAQPEARRRRAPPRSPRSASTTAPCVLRDQRASSARRLTTSSSRWPGRRSPRASAPPAASSGMTSRSTRASRSRDFAAALAGNRSGLKLRLAGAPLKAAFDGSISVKPTLKIEGTLAADAASLRDALLWAGQKPLPGGGFGRFAIKAQTNVVGGTIALSSVNVELDGNTAEGVLTFATDGRQTLQGTLAADTLDLTPYVSTVRLLTANQREWNSGRITLDGLAGIDLDLRLSAAQRHHRKRQARPHRDRRQSARRQLIVTVGEAQAFGGVIKGSFGARERRRRRRRQVAAAVHRRRSGELPRPVVRPAPARGQRQHLACRSKAPATACWRVTRTLNGTATLDRPQRRARRHQCRAIAAPAGAAAALRRRRIPHRPHAVRQDSP